MLLQYLCQVVSTLSLITLASRGVGVAVGGPSGNALLTTVFKSLREFEQSVVSSPSCEGGQEFWSSSSSHVLEEARETLEEEVYERPQCGQRVGMSVSSFC